MDEDDDAAAVPAMCELLALRRVAPPAATTLAFESCGPLWQPGHGRGVFGGQLFALAAAAAWSTVAADFALHCVHAHFLLPASTDTALTVLVTAQRDGATYATRTVAVRQRGATVLLGIAGFQRCSEAHTHSFAWLPSDAGGGDAAAIAPEALPVASEAESGMDVRYARDGAPRGSGAALLPHQRMWFRARRRVRDARSGTTGAADVQLSDEQLHTLALAYFSDMAILTTAVLPFGYPRAPVRMMATLNHSLWLHVGPNDAIVADDAFMLYECEAPSVTRSRGFALGRMFSASGVLLASAAQEGVVRLAPPDDDDPADGRSLGDTTPRVRVRAVTRRLLWSARAGGSDEGLPRGKHAFPRL